MFDYYDFEYIQMHLYESGLYITFLSEVFWQLSSVFLSNSSHSIAAVAPLGLHSLRLLQDTKNSISK